MFTRDQAKSIVSSGRRESYVPDVVIDKINTFYGSGLDRPRKITKAKMTKDKYGSVKYELNVTPKEFVVDKAIVAKLNLSIRDVDKGTWFYDVEKTKYLKIRVLQCTSPEVTRDIIDGKINIYSSRLGGIKGVKEVTIAASKRGVLSDYYSYRSGSGIIYKIPYEASFEIEHFDHVYYFAVCYLDVEAMLADGYLTKSPRKLNRYRGKITAEPLTIRGKKVNNRAAFIDQGGAIWQGPINFGPGPTSPEQADINNLRRVRVGNSKIHDYTLFDTIKSGIKLPEKKSNRKAYFSRSYMSRDKNNACRFIFSLDYLSILKDNLAFGGFVRSMPEGYKSAHIKSIKVFRQRIAEENFSPTKGTNGLKELICESADTSRGVLRKTYNNVDLNKDGTDDAYIGSISEIKLRNRGRYRSFMVFDNSVSFMDRGKYNYMVEVLMEDPTHKILLKKLRKIRKIKKDMESYYRLASKPGKFLHDSNRFSASFVGAINKQNDIPTASEYNGSQDTKAIRSAVWNRSIYDFLNILKTLTNKKFYVYSKKLSYMIRPSTGTIKGIGELIKLIEHTENMLAEIVGPSQPGSEYASDDSSNLKTAHGSMTRGIITIRHTFDEVFNSSTLNNVGYDYWGGFASSSRSGLTYLTKNSLRRRFQQTGKRTYNSLTPAEIRYSIGKINLLQSAELGDQAITANAVINQIESQSKSNPISPVGARSAPTWDVDAVSVSDSFANVDSGFFDVPINAEISVYENEQIMQSEDEISSQDFMSEGDKFNSEASDAGYFYDTNPKPLSDVEERALRDFASSLSVIEGKDYLRNLSVGIEYYAGSGAGGVADDSWQILNASVLANDGDDGAYLVRLMSNNSGVQTGNLEHSTIGAFDEVVLILPDSQNSEAQEPDDLQESDYGGAEITYDEAEETTLDPDTMLPEQSDFYEAEEVYLEDQSALDGGYVLPTQQTQSTAQQQTTVQQTPTMNRFASEPSAAFLIRGPEMAGASGTPVPPSFSYSDTPGIINTGPNGMTITFSPYDLVVAARTRTGLENQMRRSTRRSSRVSRGGSSGGGY